MIEDQTCIYVVGEVGELTPVKIGVTARPHRRRLAAYQGANWREMQYLFRRPVAIEKMLVDEFLVHEALSPWWKTGGWYDVRPVADQLGGWKQLVDHAIAGNVPGGKRFEPTSTDGDHRLAGMKRVAHTFEISCSCGHKDLHEGRLPKAIELFAANHLGIVWQRPVLDPRRVALRAERHARNRP
jgi:hypothetical protein